MVSLNYKHLRYFWMVAKAGSIARAAQQLQRTPQSISGQLQELESSLGSALFRRVGRGLELTDVGRRAAQYADRIFTLGDELLDDLRDRPARRVVEFRIGIAEGVPKSLVYPDDRTRAATGRERAADLPRGPGLPSCWRIWRCTGTTW